VDTYDNKEAHQNRIVFLEMTWANSALIWVDLCFKFKGGREGKDK